MDSKIEILGVDLVAPSPPSDPSLGCVRFVGASLTTWLPTGQLDLITCVHGLHYIGDKLGLIARAASWLTEDGLFVANLDLSNIRLADGRPASRAVAKELRKNGLDYNSRKRLLRCVRRVVPQFPFRYLGADDKAGPNYTKQPAVDSYYAQPGEHRVDQTLKQGSAKMSNNVFAPGPTPNTVRSADGKILTAPEGWMLLPPGDAALTRRVKAAGEHWIVQEKKGRKVFSRGVWATAATIERVRVELQGERATEGYAKRNEADARRRDKAQAEYVEDFHEAVVKFLAFHPIYTDLADRLAQVVADHATPVGSGTVARTKRIPVEQRAEAAVIAWMRHQTTAYETMKVPRIKGKRREVRRMLTQRSKEVLGRYRRGDAVGEECPLKKALASGD